MYIPLLIIISILSLVPARDKIGDFIIQKRKYISGFFYILSFASFFFLIGGPDIEETGEKSLELLWLILWLPIFAKVFNLVIAKKLMIFRKEIGILMGVLAFVHSLQYFLQDYTIWFWEKLFWVNPFGEITFLAWGFLALVISTVLTLTSNNYLIKKMGRSWKMLHRTVYALLIFTLIHVAMLEAGEDGIYAYIEEFVPFVIYFGFKILEWKGIVLRK